MQPSPDMLHGTMLDGTFPPTPFTGSPSGVVLITAKQAMAKIEVALTVEPSPAYTEVEDVSLKRSQSFPELSKHLSFTSSLNSTPFGFDAIAPENKSWWAHFQGQLPRVPMESDQLSHHRGPRHGHFGSTECPRACQTSMHFKEPSTGLVRIALCSVSFV